MKKVSDLFTMASGVFGVIPGLTVLLTNIGVPPDESKELYGGIIEALGIVTLLMLWLNKSRIANATEKSITNWALICVGLFLVMLFVYLFVYNYYVIKSGHSKPLFFPFWPQGDLQYNLWKYGGRMQIIRAFGRDDVYTLIEESSKVALIFTSLIFLLIYQAVFMSVTMAFGLLGIKISTSEPSTADTA